jgi:hypothetical protein
MSLFQFQSHLFFLHHPNARWKTIVITHRHVLEHFGKDLPDKYLPIRTLLYVLFEHILISRTNSIVTPEL